MKATNFVVLATGIALFSACSKEPVVQPQTADETLLQSKPARVDEGMVYTLSNGTSDNRVLIYKRAADGKLMYDNSYSTGGKGTGGGLGNQGAICLSDNGNMLLVVNPGSNSISTFKMNGNSMNLKSMVSSGGTMPVSITSYGDLVYVLNAGSSSISGFRMQGNSGMLNPISNSSRMLSAANAMPAQISFVNDGKALAITEKATNKITTFTVTSTGTPGMMHSITSATPTPFGFSVGMNGNIFVSEAAGGAPNMSTLSSYNVDNDGMIMKVAGPVTAEQTAACWVVMTKNGMYAYTTNTGSNNLSSFMTNASSGSIAVKQAVAAPAGTGPIDAALSKNDNYLYVLNSMSHTITAYSVGTTGGLNLIQTVSGIPAGATGMAAQ